MSTIATSSRPHERIALSRLRASMLGDETPTGLSRYRIEETLGQGGNGIVYAAYDPQLRRRVAIKLLSGRGLSVPAAQQRMLREARSLARLSHPHVVTVFDVGSVRGGGVYLVMELLPGPTLAEHARTHTTDWQTVLERYMQAGRGLAAAHEAGLVHRDFKPENAMFDAAGRVKVLDFGLVYPAADEAVTSADDDTPWDVSGAAAVSASSPESRLTATGTVMGTPRYMAPEQHMRRDVDAAVDQYALCLSLLEALGGGYPYAASDPVTLVQAKLRAPAVPALPAGVPRAVAEVIGRGLRSRPSSRWATMGVLLEALDRARRPRRRRGAWWALAAAAVLPAAAVYAASLDDAGPCEAAGDGELAGVWDDDARQRVRRTIERSGLPHEDAMTSRVVLRLDAWAERWQDVRTEACREHADAWGGDGSDPTAGEELARPGLVPAGRALDDTMACLQRRRGALASLVETIERGRTATLANAPTLVAELPSPLDCADSIREQQAEPRPTDPALAVEVDALRADIRAAYTSMNALGARDVAPSARGLVRRAERTGFEPIVAEALGLHARAVTELGDHEGGDRLLRDAMLRAEAARHDLEVARLAPLVIYSTGVHLGRLDDALEEIPGAMAMLRRAGDFAPAAGGLHQTIGHLRLRTGELDAAQQAFESARYHYGRATPPREAGLADAAYGLSLVERARGNSEEAVRIAGQAVAAAQDAMGELSPNVAMMREEYAWQLMMLERQDEAEREIATAVEVIESVRGREHPDLLQMLHGLASIQRRVDPDTAAVTGARGLALAHAIRGRDHEQTAWLEHIMSLIEADRARYDAALRHSDQALAIFETIRGAESSEVATVHGGRSTIHTQMGDVDSARTELLAARAIAVALGRDEIVTHVDRDLAGLPAVAPEGEPGPEGDPDDDPLSAGS